MNMEFQLLDSYKGRIRMTLEDAPPTPRTPPAKDEPLSEATAKRGANGDGDWDACGNDKNKEHASALHHPATGHPTGHAGRHSPEKCEDHKACSPKSPAGAAPSKSTFGDKDVDDDGSSPFPREFASRLCAVLTIDGVQIPPVKPK